jgi:aldehyde dehydrogenase (NAD+)
MPYPADSLRLQALRCYYNSRVTRPHAFRVQQLLRLKSAILKNEQAIQDALLADLNKGREESFASETGLVLAEIKLAVKNLRRWMKPVRTRTNLLNLPSSSRIVSEPKGVVLLVSPWNYPFQLTLIPLIGAIAAGNCVVIKPSELAPASSSVLSRIISETFEPGYVLVCEGEGQVVVPGLVENFQFDHIFYTGSTCIGKTIYQLASKHLVPVTLELGGKSPAIVEADADLRTAVKRIALGKFLNAGQTCVAPDYLLVHNKVLDRFIREFKDTILQFFGEYPKNSPDYGKIINGKRFDRLLSFLRDGEIISGGHHDRSGLYIEPTLLKNVPLDAAIMQEEIFGPVLPVFGFETRAEALSIISRNPNPLAFYVFTSSKEKENGWIEQVAFGGGCVNNTIWHLSNPHLPFGGTGNSGMGAYHGKYSFDTFTHRKSVMKTPSWFDPYFKYPPFKGKLKWLRFLIK